MYMLIFLTEKKTTLWKPHTVETIDILAESKVVKVVHLTCNQFQLWRLWSQPSFGRKATVDKALIAECMTQESISVAPVWSYTLALSHVSVNKFSNMETTKITNEQDGHL